MGDYVRVSNEEDEETKYKTSNTRLTSLDVFRGLSVFLMILVDYAGSLCPSISHSPWNGVHLADFVMPLFLFIVGVSLAFVFKSVQNKIQATRKAVLRALQLFFLGVLLQGGYFHGITSLTFGVDIESMRWLGILQRISIGYIVAAMCKIWLPCRTRRGEMAFHNYYLHWCLALALSFIHSGLLYGLYVPDWQFSISHSTPFASSANHTHLIYTVKCAVSGDLGPACNSAGMIDRYVLGVDHLYKKPTYKNLEECRGSKSDRILDTYPPWCLAPFDPEGLLSSLTASVTCIMGLQYGHVLLQFKDHKERLYRWFLLSFSLLSVGLILSYAGIPLNKSLYTSSYMALTSGSAGITFCVLYALVDVYGFRRLTSVLEWMGVHSMGIFVLVTSNLAVIAIQGFYWASPDNNVINWIVMRFVHK